MGTKIEIVGDFNYEKPFMIVKYEFGENNYVSHKVIDRFKTEKEAQQFKNKLREQ